MKHKVKISVSERPETGGVIACRSIRLRERILRFLAGERRKVTVLIPGNSVEEIAICEVKGEDENGQEETGA